MEKDRMFSNLKLLYGSEMTGRIKWEDENTGKVTVTADLHMMTKHEARQFIKNVIALLYMLPEFSLDLIHGYNGGTSLKEMIYCEELSPRIKEIHSPCWNPGESILEIASLS